MQETKKGFFDNIKEMEKANFYDYLSVMIDWGVAISEILDSFQARVKNKYLIWKIQELKAFIDAWDNLSKSMKKMPEVFEDAEVAIIESWENSWKLYMALATLSEKMREKYELKKKIKWSLTYPMIIIIFLIIAVSIVMIVVIPALLPIFESSDVELPIATKALVATSDFFTANILAILFSIAAWIFFIVGYKKTRSWKSFFDNLMLEIPLISDISKNYIISNIATNLWTLITGWIPIMKALTLTWRGTNSMPYVEAFEEIKDGVSKGNKLVETMVEVDKEWKLFPADFLQMLSVWEKTASMEKVCVKINRQYNREVQSSLDNLTKWVEPIAILIAWIFVLWFAFAVFSAILEVTKNI